MTSLTGRVYLYVYVCTPGVVGHYQKETSVRLHPARGGWQRGGGEKSRDHSSTQSDFTITTSCFFRSTDVIGKEKVFVMLLHKPYSMQLHMSTKNDCSDCLLMRCNINVFKRYPKELFVRMQVLKSSGSGI